MSDTDAALAAFTAALDQLRRLQIAQHTKVAAMRPEHPDYAAEHGTALGIGQAIDTVWEVRRRHMTPEQIAADTAAAHRFAEDFLAGTAHLHPENAADRYRVRQLKAAKPAQ